MSVLPARYRTSAGHCSTFALCHVLTFAVGQRTTLREALRLNLSSHRIEKFDPSSARWTPIQQIFEPGAYRARLWGLSYLYVSQDDLTDRGQPGRLSTSASSDFVGKSKYSFAKSQPSGFGVGPAAQRFILHPRVKSGLSRK